MCEVHADTNVDERFREHQAKEMFSSLIHDMLHVHVR
jgi:hypothetical protein